MTAPAPVELEQDCDDQLGHYMCSRCDGEPVMGRVYRGLCGIRKEYRGPAWGAAICAVCAELRRLPCEVSCR